MLEEEKPRVYGKYKVSIDKILELKNKGLGSIRIGKELGVNYKVIQRAYNKYKNEIAIKIDDKTNIEGSSKYNSKLYKIYDNSYWQLGMLIVGYGKEWTENKELKAILSKKNVRTE